MSKYYQALTKIQAQYNEKLQKEAEQKKGDSVFVNSVDDKIKSYSNLEKTRDVLGTLRPLFIILGIIALCVVFFVGVRQGMMIKAHLEEKSAREEAVRIEAAKAAEAKQPSLPVPLEDSVPSGEASAIPGPVQQTGTAADTGITGESVPAEIPQAAEPKKTVPEGKYTIQLITYSDPSSAESEVKRLRAKGYESFIVPSGRYLQVCMNGFKTASDARRFQAEISKKGELSRYPGAYVREIPAL